MTGAGALAEWPIAVVAVIRHGRTATVRWAPGLVVGTAAVLAFLLIDQRPSQSTPRVLTQPSVSVQQRGAAVCH